MQLAERARFTCQWAPWWFALQEDLHAVAATHAGTCEEPAVDAGGAIDNATTQQYGAQPRTAMTTDSNDYKRAANDHGGALHAVCCIVVLHHSNECPPLLASHALQCAAW